MDHKFITRSDLSLAARRLTTHSHVILSCALAVELRKSNFDFVYAISRNAQYTPPTRLHCRVESRRRCVLGLSISVKFTKVCRIVRKCQLCVTVKFWTKISHTHTHVYLKWQHNNAEYKTQKYKKKHTKQNRIVKTRQY